MVLVVCQRRVDQLYVYKTLLLRYFLHPFTRGLYHCTLVFLALAHFRGIGIGVFQTYYELNDLKAYSPSAISWISSLETWIVFGSGAVIGKIYDTFGPFWMIFVGTLLHVFGIMMISLSHEYYQIFLSQAICSPLGASCLFYAGMFSLCSLIDVFSHETTAAPMRLIHTYH